MFRFRERFILCFPHVRVNAIRTGEAVQFEESKDLWRKHRNQKRERGNVLGPRLRFLMFRQQH